MKRREFVTLSAMLALMASSPLHAAKKQTSQKSSSKSASPSKSSNKKSAKPTTSDKKPETVRTVPAASATATESSAIPASDTPRNAISLPDEPAPQWRHYDIRSTVVLKNISGRARLWLPLVQYRDTPWERSLGHQWQGNFQTAGIYRDPVADMEVFYADWPEGASEQKLEIVSRIATQDRHFDITRRTGAVERTEILRRCLRTTELVPTDGIVRRTAERAIGRVKDPLAQGKAIYDWVVENTRYDPQTRLSSTGNIARFLEDGQLTGRSLEISLLFVGLCRSVGIPARPVFGLRIDRSRLFASLGAEGELNAAQHCRAELYSPGYGWVPVDPSDVRRAAQSENLSHADPKLNVLKKLLFGFWEMNWVGFNAAQDIILQGGDGKPLPFLTSPVVETPGGRYDSPASGHFSYSVGAQRT